MNIDEALVWEEREVAVREPERGTVRELVSPIVLGDRHDDSPLTSARVRMGVARTQGIAKALAMAATTKEESFMLGDYELGAEVVAWGRRLRWLL